MMMTGKIKEGYKETEIGIIPKEWDVKELGKIGCFKKGKGIKKDEIQSNGLPCIRYGEIYTTYNHVAHNINSFINEETSRESVSISKGEIIFAGSGETIEDIGKAVVYLNEEPCFVGGDTIIMKPNELVDSLYLSYFLSTKIVAKQKRKLGQGNSIVHLYVDGVRSINVVLPTNEEQQRIGEILSTTDAHIEKIDKTIEDYQLLKKGLMQKLLTEGIGHTEFKETEIGRIPKEWEVVKIKDISKVVTGRTPPTNNKLLYGDDYPWVTPADISDEPEIYVTERMLSHEGFKSTTVNLPPNTLLITCIASIGKNAILRNEGSCNQQINAIFPDDSIFSVEYLYYWANQSKQYIEGFSAKTSIAILNKSTFENIQVALPSLSEQKEIAIMLTSIDCRIKLYQNEKSNFIQLKKSLMEKLLTGKIRVNNWIS